MDTFTQKSTAIIWAKDTNAITQLNKIFTTVGKTIIPDDMQLILTKGYSQEQDNHIATQSSAGFMSAADKSKLNKIQVDFDNRYEPLNWHAIKAAGIDFAICRTSFGKSGIDPTFIQNVNGAHDAGLICGAYHYSYALTPADAGVLLELPVWFDMEDADGYKARHGFIFSRRNIKTIYKAFLDNVTKISVKNG